MNKIKPIFVLGSARNGTTWLCNMLCRHPQVSGAQHKAHWGIHESFIYENIKYWGDISNDEKFIKFIETYSSADYFNLVNGKKDYFYNNRPDNFLEFFFELMDQYSKENNSLYWVTKLDNLYYYRPKDLKKFFEEVNKRYSSYKIIGIKRNFQPVLKSYINMEGKDYQKRGSLFIREMAIILEAARWATHYNNIEKITKKNNGLMISFSDFKNNHKKSIRQIINFLELEFDNNLLKTKYKPNSSFQNKTQIEIPKSELIFADKILIKLFTKVPSLGKLIVKFRDLVRGNKCPVYWKLLKLKYMKNSFLDELKKSGDIGLYKLLSNHDHYE